ncbi:MAG: type II toxin-antitoxin system VapB family antitoxin, partial [Bosea sp.]|nr:type II toxin-antitoxin system VapB family antitoxin [Bosea sp. (in: a-proteobacteria)]
MAILIKDPETDRIVRELAARTGKTITDAVKTAAEREL